MGCIWVLQSFRANFPTNIRFRAGLLASAVEAKSWTGREQMRSDCRIPFARISIVSASPTLCGSPAGTEPSRGWKPRRIQRNRPVSKAFNMAARAKAGSAVGILRLREHSGGRRHALASFRERICARRLSRSSRPPDIRAAHFCGCSCSGACSRTTPHSSTGISHSPACSDRCCCGRRWIIPRVPGILGDQAVGNSAHLVDADMGSFPLSS